MLLLLSGILNISPLLGLSSLLFTMHITSDTITLPFSSCLLWTSCWDWPSFWMQSCWTFRNSSMLMTLASLEVTLSSTSHSSLSCLNDSLVTAVRTFAALAHILQYQCTWLFRSRHRAFFTSQGVTIFMMFFLQSGQSVTRATASGSWLAADVCWLQLEPLLAAMVVLFFLCPPVISLATQYVVRYINLVSGQNMSYHTHCSRAQVDLASFALRPVFSHQSVAFLTHWLGWSPQYF